jgi:dolichyl-diphosphooligosaccharide--protein glycosyltransferase
MFPCPSAAFSTRLFAVLRFESVIHEFDPYFNFRTTKYLAAEGFYSFHNWFDDRAWYPLGRIIGGTIYPGLMMTSAFLYHVMHLVNITIDIRHVCVFLAPLFSSLTVLVTYHLTKELKDASAGLVAAAMIAIVPGYISRSVAGSYDNEGIAIFCMLLTYTLWIKSVKTGSVFWSTLCSIAYFYMVSSWGGYVFLINLIPMHVLALMITGRFSHRIYVAYCSVYCLGTILSMQISFVGFQPVQSSEHMAVWGIGVWSIGVWGTGVQGIGVWGVRVWVVAHKPACHHVNWWEVSNECIHRCHGLFERCLATKHHVAVLLGLWNINYQHNAYCSS